MAPAALALSGPVPRWPRGAARCLPRRPPAPNVGGAVPALSKDGGRKCPLLLGSQPSLRAGLGSEMAAAELEYESVLCVKPDVSVYRIPPRTSNRGYRCSALSGPGGRRGGRGGGGGGLAGAVRTAAGTVLAGVTPAPRCRGTRCCFTTVG